MNPPSTLETPAQKVANNATLPPTPVALSLPEPALVTRATAEILPLTGLRFVAAFVVFLFHMNMRWPLGLPPMFNNVLGQGAIGMSLFFMLSGFVLSYRYGSGDYSVKSYLVSRVARIYPVYLVAAVVTLPWLGIALSHQHREALWHNIAQAVLLIGSNVLLLQAWFTPMFSLWNNGGSWSISVEAFCYVCLPLLLPLLMRCSKQHVPKVLLGAWLLALLPGLVATAFTHPANGAFYSLPIFRLPEFVMGMCLYQLVSTLPKWLLKPWVLPTVLAVFVAYLAMVGPSMVLYVGHSWLALPVIALSIATMVAGKGPLVNALASKPMVWLGKISYSFYSFQVLVILWLISNHGGVVKVAPVLANNGLLALTALVTLVLLSAIGYYGIEVPAGRWVKRRFSP
jgi:peptidoglycan/LPS O-acetylase OafA/YrhL